MLRKFFGLLLFVACTYSGRAQLNDTTEMTYQVPDSLLMDEVLSLEDSLDIFFLIDSLLQLDDIESISQFAVRIGYNSNVNSTGRTLGISEFGLNAGVAYYHKTGLYLDVSGNWTTNFEPSYYLTTASVGYMGIYKNWSYIAEYGRIIFTQPPDPDLSTVYKNNLGITNFIELKPVTFRFDYFLYFGDKVGHRLMPGISLNFEKKNWSKLQRVLFYPSINVLFGSEEITTYIPYSNTYLGNAYRLRQGLPLYYTDENTSFGVMNYSFSLPLLVSIKRWGFSLGYTYNIPKVLPGEDIELSNNGFVSFSVSRFFSL
ncbi:MAG: hypothetical protein HC811_07240 [Flammeovirgaceae bacterium]|nr:hypothetical protein [Flammeovirgaceae bacterium]